MPNSTKTTIWEIGLSMLELQQKYSELSPHKQIQRKTNANSTEYFLVFLILKFYTYYSNPLLSQSPTRFSTH